MSAWIGVMEARFSDAAILANALSIWQHDNARHISIEQSLSGQRSITVVIRQTSEKLSMTNSPSTRE